MSVQIYWTDSPNIAPHAPLMLESRDRWEGKLDPRFEPWGRPQEKRLPDLKAMGFKLEESTEEGECYVVHSRLILDCKGANVELVWQIARPDSRLYDGKMLLSLALHTAAVCCSFDGDRANMMGVQRMIIGPRPMISS